MTGSELIAAERQRQIDAEGWTPEHDDEHSDFALSQAARVYGIEAMRIAQRHPRLDEHDAAVYGWPEDWTWNPSSDPIRNLVKAGALIAAEIDRLQRGRVTDPAEGSAS